MRPLNQPTVCRTGLKLIAIIGILLIALPGAASAKSLYVVADINADPTPIQAYDIQGNTVVYQATHNVTNWAGGAVGLTIDTDSATLFATYEFTNVIQLLDATTFADLGTTTAPSAGNLAGIVVDQDKGLVYTVDRSTDDLYVYIWDAVAKTLTLDDQVDLPNVTEAYGIALDETNDLLYVADYASTTVRYFNTADWTEAGSFTISQNPVGIALDVKNGLVYLGNACNGNLLVKYDLNTDVETTLDLGEGDTAVGLAVDPVTSLLYITTGNQCGSGSDALVVFDSTLQELDRQAQYFGDPTALCVPGKEISYNPLGLTKDDALAEDECVPADEELTYQICFDNTPNDFTANEVAILDTLPAEASPVSASDGGVYDAGTHSVLWEIGELAPGAAQQCVELVVLVDGAEPGGTITNTATISFYPSVGTDQIPSVAVATTQPIQTTVNETTNICEEEPAPQPLPCPDCPDNDQMLAAGWFCPGAGVTIMGLLLVGIFATAGRTRRW